MISLLLDHLALHAEVEAPAQTRDHMREGQASSSTSEPRTPLHDADTRQLSLLPNLVVRSP